MFISPERIDKALAAIGGDRYALVNAVSRRVKQLQQGAEPQVHSLEKMTPEDIALQEIIEHKIVIRY